MSEICANIELCTRTLVVKYIMLTMMIGGVETATGDEWYLLELGRIFN